MEKTRMILNWIWKILSFILVWIWKAISFVCMWIWDYFILYLKTPKTISGGLDRRFTSARILESKEKGCGCVVFIVVFILILICILFGEGQDKNANDDLSDTMMVEKKTAKKTTNNRHKNNDIGIIKDTTILIDTTIDLIQVDTIKSDSLMEKAIDTDSVFN